MSGLQNNRKPPVVIIGAGLGGLTAANFLAARGIPVVVYEAGKSIAGLAASFEEDGFSYDFGAHFITNRLAHAIGVASECQNVRHYGEAVFLNGRFYRYPLGLIANGRFLSSALAAKLLSRRPPAPQSLREKFRRQYGKALADEVAIPLAEAWSGVAAGELSPSVADKIPVGILHQLFLIAMRRLTGRAIAIGYGKEKPSSVGVWHVYPKGGVNLLCRRLAEPIAESIRTECKVDSIVVENNRALGVEIDGGFVPASAVVSTAPCNLLPRLIKGSTKLDHLTRFRFRPMVFAMLRLRGRRLLKDTVVWVPELKFPFFRLTETTISMPWLAPEGKTLITVDFGCERNDETWSNSADDLAEICLEHLTPFIPDVRSRYEGIRILRTPYAYPVFLREYEAQRRSFGQNTGIASLYSVGRNGEFDHLLTEDVYWRTLTKMNGLLRTLETSQD